MNQSIVIAFHNNGSILAHFYSLFFAFCKQKKREHNLGVSHEEQVGGMDSCR
jgi:hypothetical protein